MAKAKKTIDVLALEKKRQEARAARASAKPAKSSAIKGRTFPKKAEPKAKAKPEAEK